MTKLGIQEANVKTKVGIVFGTAGTKVKVTFCPKIRKKIQSVVEFAETYSDQT